MTTRTTAAPRAGFRLPLQLFLVLGTLTAFGPLATDLYLPAMPDLATALGTSDALAQLTISSCLVGLALGQLVAGPMSDRVGRRTPLLVGVGLFAVSSVACALATDVRVLLTLRLVQGLCGSAGLVIARAVVRDLYQGSAAARVYSQLMLVMGVAPIAAPLLGGQILHFTDWRGLFVALGVIGALILAGAWLVLPETHAEGDRHTGGVGETVRHMAGVLRDGVFRGHMLIGGMQGATLFTYISMSTFVLRSEFGITPQEYSAVFAVNALGLVLGSQLNGALVMRWGPRRMLAGQLTLTVTGSAGVLVAGAVDAGMVALLVPLWVVVFSMGGMMANNTALALSRHGRAAGSASALLGTSQFLMGALLPPLASVGGTSALRMGLSMTVAMSLALLILVLVSRRRRGDARADVEGAACGSS